MTSEVKRVFSPRFGTQVRPRDEIKLSRSSISIDDVDKICFRVKQSSLKDLNFADIRAVRKRLRSFSQVTNYIYKAQRAGVIFSEIERLFDENQLLVCTAHTPTGTARYIFVEDEERAIGILQEAGINIKPRRSNPSATPHPIS